MGVLIRLIIKQVNLIICLIYYVFTFYLQHFISLKSQDVHLWLLFAIKGLELGETGLFQLELCCILTSLQLSGKGKISLHILSQFTLASSASYVWTCVVVKNLKSLMKIIYKVKKFRLKLNNWKWQLRLV